MYEKTGTLTKDALFLHNPTRWAPSRYKWIYNLFISRVIAPQANPFIPSHFRGLITPIYNGRLRANLVSPAIQSGRNFDPKALSESRGMDASAVIPVQGTCWTWRCVHLLREAPPVSEKMQVHGINQDLISSRSKSSVQRNPPSCWHSNIN